jgi:hypothetical protein
VTRNNNRTNVLGNALTFSGTSHLISGVSIPALQQCLGSQKYLCRSLHQLPQSNVPFPMKSTEERNPVADQ